MQELQVWSLDREDPLEEEMATRSSILAWEIPRTEEPDGLQSVVLQSLIHVQLFVTPWTAARQASLSFSISQSLFKLMSIESVILFKYLIFYCPLLLLPSIFPNIRVFFSKLAPHIRWPKYYSLSFSISSFNEYSGLISFRIGWFDLLAVQGTLKSLFSTTIQKH